MGLVDLSSVVWYPQPTWLNASPSFDTNGVIDASTDRIAIVFQAPRDLTVTKIAVGYGACATPATVNYRIETVSGSPDQPSGSLLAANNTTGSVTPVANTVVEGTLTANASLTARTVYAAVIQSATTPINIIVNRFLSTNIQSSGQFPVGWNNLTGAYAAVTALPCLALKDTTLGYVFLNAAILPAESLGSQAINTGTGASTGTRRGVLLNLPFRGRLARLIPRITMPLTADFDIILYDSGGTALQTMLSVTADTQRVANGANGFEYILNPYTIEANTFYRLAIVPTTANSVTLREFTVGALMNNTAGWGTNCLSTAYISSVWTNINNTFPWWSLGFDQLDDGTGVSRSRNFPIGAGNLY